MSEENLIQIVIPEKTPEEYVSFVHEMLKSHKKFNEEIRQNPVEDPAFGIFPVKGKLIDEEK